MPRRFRMADVCSYDSSSSEELYTHIPVRPRHTRHGSVVSSHHHHHVHEPMLAGPRSAFPAGNLAVPVVDMGGRKRASSTSGMPQPNIIINADVGSRASSRERYRPRSRSRGRYYPEEEEGDFQEMPYRGRPARSPSTYSRDYEVHVAMERLRVMDEEKAQEEAEERYRKELEVKKAKEQLQIAEEAKRNKEVGDKAIENWQRKKDADAKKKKEKEEEEAQAKEDLDNQIKAGVKHRLENMGHLVPKDNADRITYNENCIARLRPTYIKVRTEHLHPETLRHYDIPWEYYNSDKEYIVLMKRIGEDELQGLFAHTESRRYPKAIMGPIVKQTVWKSNDERKNRLCLVRKKY